jgi:hypothetical protein
MEIINFKNLYNLMNNYLSLHRIVSQVQVYFLFNNEYFKFFFYWSLGDDSSRMSFSSTSSKESSSVGTSTNNGNAMNGNVLHSSFSKPGKTKKIIENFEWKFSFQALSVTTSVSENHSIPLNGKNLFDRNFW